MPEGMLESLVTELPFAETKVGTPMTNEPRTCYEAFASCLVSWADRAE